MGPGKKVVKGREIRQNSLAGSCKVTLLGRTLINIFIRRFPGHCPAGLFICQDGLTASLFFCCLLSEPPLWLAVLLTGWQASRSVLHFLTGSKVVTTKWELKEPLWPVHHHGHGWKRTMHPFHYGSYPYFCLGNMG